VTAVGSDVREFEEPSGPTSVSPHGFLIWADVSACPRLQWAAIGSSVREVGGLKLLLALACTGGCNWH